MCRVLRRNTQQTLLFAESFFLVKIFVVIDFFHNLTNRLIRKIMQVSFTLNVTCIIIVGILSLTYPFTHLR
jgi:hypothetical protein